MEEVLEAPICCDRMEMQILVLTRMREIDVSHSDSRLLRHSQDYLFCSCRKGVHPQPAIEANSCRKPFLFVSGSISRVFWPRGEGILFSQKYSLKHSLVCSKVQGSILTHSGKPYQHHHPKATTRSHTRSRDDTLVTLISESDDFSTTNYIIMFKATSNLFLSIVSDYRERVASSGRSSIEICRVPFYQ